MGEGRAELQLILWTPWERSRLPASSFQVWRGVRHRQRDWLVFGGGQIPQRRRTQELVAEGCRCLGQEFHSCGLASRGKSLTPFLGYMT